LKKIGIEDIVVLEIIKS